MRLIHCWDLFYPSCIIQYKFSLSFLSRKWTINKYHTPLRRFSYSWNIVKLFLSFHLIRNKCSFQELHPRRWNCWGDQVLLFSSCVLVSLMNAQLYWFTISRSLLTKIKNGIKDPNLKYIHKHSDKQNTNEGA